MHLQQLRHQVLAANEAELQQRRSPDTCEAHKPPFVQVPSQTTHPGTAVFPDIPASHSIYQLLCRYGAELDALSPKGWTALSYAKAHGKYGPTEEAGIYPEVRLYALLLLLWQPWQVL
jgi:hypothetical protein